MATRRERVQDQEVATRYCRIIAWGRTIEVVRGKGEREGGREQKEVLNVWYGPTVDRGAHFGDRRDECVEVLLGRGDRVRGHALDLEISAGRHEDRNAGRYGAPQADPAPRPGRVEVSTRRRHRTL